MSRKKLFIALIFAASGLMAASYSIGRYQWNIDSVTRPTSTPILTPTNPGIPTRTPFPTLENKADSPTKFPTRIQSEMVCIQISKNGSCFDHYCIKGHSEELQAAGLKYAKAYSDAFDCSIHKEWDDVTKACMEACEVNNPISSWDRNECIGKCPNAVRDECHVPEKEAKKQLDDLIEEYCTR